MAFKDVITDWKVIGAITGLLSLGASGMAATVSGKLDHHTQQTDSVLVELRAIHRIQSIQLCLQLGIEDRLECLQK